MSANRAAVTGMRQGILALTIFLLAGPLCGQAQVLLATVPVGAAPVAVAANTVTNQIYVVNQSSNNVTVIDGVTNRTSNVAVGSLPVALAINSSTNKIYVANENNNTVTSIDGATHTTSTIAVGGQPIAIAINTATNKIYVANYLSSNVTVVKAATGSETTVAVGLHPVAVAVNPVANKTYVVSAGNDSVSVIDENNNVAAIAVGHSPQALAINQLTNKIYVANYGASTVSVIDGATQSVVTVDVGAAPSALAVNSVTNQIYVANSHDATVSIIDGGTLLTTTINVGTTPEAVVVDGVSNKIYIANYLWRGTLEMIDGTNNSVVDVPVGVYPKAVAVNLPSNRIYAANVGENTVSVIAGAASGPLQFVPVTPCRVADTRLPQGTFGGPSIAGGSSRSFAISAGGCGLPRTAAAYALNVTVVPQVRLGFLTIWPTGEPQPVNSTLNSLDGRIKANAALIPAGAGGAVSVYANDTTDVVIDINGYFEPPASQTFQFYPLTPCRVLDTRNTAGSLGGPSLHSKQERDFPVLSSNCHIPATAKAYSMNFTVVPVSGQALGFLTVWPAGQTQPSVSTLNNPKATIVANAAIVPAGVNGAIAVYPNQNTDLAVDIDGYFDAPGPHGLSFYSSAPCRVLDTRTSGGAFSGQRNPPVDVVDGPCGIPNTAQAYVFNATVVPPGRLGYLTLWPDSKSQPLASTLNAVDGAITSNMAVVPSVDGKTAAYASATTQLIMDISGYFAP